MQKVILSLFCPILVTIIIRVILFIIAFVLGFLGFIFNARKEYVDFVSNIGTFETFVWNESWLFWGIVVIITFVAEMIIWSVQNGTVNIQEIGTNLKNSTEQLLRTEPEPHTNSDNKNSIYNQSEIYKKHYEEDEKNWRNNELQAEKKKKHEEVLRKERQYLAEMQAKRIFNPIISRISLLYLAILIIPSVIMFIFFCLVEEGSSLSAVLGISSFAWMIIGGILINVFLRIHIKRKIGKWQMDHPNHPCSSLPIKYYY